MKKLIFLFAVALASWAASAQSADMVSQILESEGATFAQAAYMASCAAGAELDAEEAFLRMRDSGVIGAEASADDALTLRQFAWICASTWDVRGSVMLRLFPGPRYALRQMKADGVIEKSADGGQIVSGRQMLNIVADCIDLYRLKEEER